METLGIGMYDGKNLSQTTKCTEILHEFDNPNSISSLNEARVDSMLTDFCTTGDIKLNA